MSVVCVDFVENQLHWVLDLQWLSRALVRSLSVRCVDSLHCVSEFHLGVVGLSSQYMYGWINKVNEQDLFRLGVGFAMVVARLCALSV